METRVGKMMATASAAEDHAALRLGRRPNSGACHPTVFSARSRPAIDGARLLGRFRFLDRICSNVGAAWRASRPWPWERSLPGGSSPLRRGGVLRSLGQTGQLERSLAWKRRTSSPLRPCRLFEGCTLAELEDQLLAFGRDVNTFGARGEVDVDQRPVADFVIAGCHSEPPVIDIDSGR